MFELYINYKNTPDKDEYEVLIFNLAWMAPVIFTIISFAYKRLTLSAWERSVFPSDLKYNKDNLLQAYICLAAWMLNIDRKSSREKIEYMNRYFRSHFGKRDFRESLNHAYKNPIDQKTISAWLNQNLNTQERSQVLHFLTGISIIDGSININEKLLLNQVREVLGVSQKDLDSIIASYYQQRNRKRTKSSSSSTSSYTRKSALKLSFEILGVSEHAAMDEIKKAYRSLVKKHHPDRFATNSPEQQKIAETRFIEIQKAYETIEKQK